MTCRNSKSPQSTTDGGWTFAAPRSPCALQDSVKQTLLERPVYAYIVTTIEVTSDFELCQHGSAPNFHGRRITLCTCKHKDRATFFRMLNNGDDPWKDVWVAGLTSKRKSEKSSRGLAYLMCVKRSFLNQRELWDFLPAHCRAAKSASNSKLGDLFKPKKAAKHAPYNPKNYFVPIVEHSHSQPKDPNLWYKDIRRWGRLPHRLLLGDTTESYRWKKMAMVLKSDAIGCTAHHRKFPSLGEFIASLEEFHP